MVKTSYSASRKIYAAVVGLVGLGLLAWGLPQQHLTPEQWLYIGVLSILSVVLHAVGSELPNGTYVGIDAVAYYAAMLTLNPWAAAVVAVWPNVRWAVVTRANGWAFIRNAGMYVIMGYAAATAYQALTDQHPLASLSFWALGGLVAAVIVARLLNEALLLPHTALASGWEQAWNNMRETWLVAWAADGLAYFPALLTALIFARIGWDGLLIWLLVLMGGALALYQMVNARQEVTLRLTDLSKANTHLVEHDKMESILSVRLGQASEDLAGYASRLALALREQHTAVTQVTSTVEELAQQARYIAEAAGSVDTMSETALATASRGQEAAAASVRAMEELEHHVREMHTRMGTLEGRSRNIHRTLQTINNIAGETHLLALNATIEAAGAGEHGRRFSVVAQQINALADQALRAAGEIQATVREIEAATADTKSVIEAGLMETRRYTGQVDEARRSMEGILGAVGRTSDMAQQIRLATQQQTQASNQVTDAVREIATSMGTATTEGAAVHDAAQNLRRIAGELRGLDNVTNGSAAYS